MGLHPSLLQESCLWTDIYLLFLLEICVTDSNYKETGGRKCNSYSQQIYLMILYEAWMICGGERDISVQCLLFPKHWQLLKWKKILCFSDRSFMYFCVPVALVHRNNQEFGICSSSGNALHQEIIVLKDLFKKTNISWRYLACSLECESLYLKGLS